MNIRLRYKNGEPNNLQRGINTRKQKKKELLLTFLCNSERRVLELGKPNYFRSIISVFK